MPWVCRRGASGACLWPRGCSSAPSERSRESVSASPCSPSSSTTSSSASTRRCISFRPSRSKSTLWIFWRLRSPRSGSRRLRHTTRRAARHPHFRPRHSDGNSMTDDILLSGEGIHKRFELDSRRLEVLRGVDIAVRRGEFISVVGASGSGKSTLLHILGGLDRPSEGRVLWSQRDIARLPDDELARARGAQVGFVFQFHHLLGEFTARENVM